MKKKSYLSDMELQKAIDALLGFSETPGEGEPGYEHFIKLLKLTNTEEIPELQKKKGWENILKKQIKGSITEKEIQSSQSSFKKPFSAIFRFIKQKRIFSYSFIM